MASRTYKWFSQIRRDNPNRYSIGRTYHELAIIEVNDDGLN